MNIGAVLKDLIDHQGNLEVVVDMYRLRRVDVTGVRVLRLAAGWARSRGASFRLADPPLCFSPTLRGSRPGRGNPVLPNGPDVLIADDA
jgi:hypothetical protein